MATSTKQPAKRKTGGTEDKRGRVFALVFYPDSIPEDWLERLRGTMLKGFVSPLHDKDVNDDGTPKKPHYHLLLMFGQNAKKNYDTQIKPLMEQCFGTGFTREINVSNATGYARYLCHIDNPEKYQYDKNDVIELGGASYITTINCTEDNLRILRDITVFVRENHIRYYHALVDYCMENNLEWFHYLSKNCYEIREYMKSINAAVRDFERSWEREKNGLPSGEDMYEAYIQYEEAKRQQSKEQEKEA